MERKRGKETVMDKWVRAGERVKCETYKHSQTVQNLSNTTTKQLSVHKRQSAECLG